MGISPVFQNTDACFDACSPQAAAKTRDELLQTKNSQLNRSSFVDGLGHPLPTAGSNLRQQLRDVRNDLVRRARLLLLRPAV